jgi:hypothetical protein
MAEVYYGLPPELEPKKRAQKVIFASCWAAAAAAVVVVAVVAGQPAAADGQWLRLQRQPLV